MVANATLAFALVYGIGVQALETPLGECRRLAAQALPPMPAVRFPLHDTAAAKDTVQSGGIRGWC